MSFVQVCVVYVIKKVASFRGLGQLMGVVRKRICTRATVQQEDLGRM